MINACLWSAPDEPSMRATVMSWLRDHRITYSKEMTTEELIQLYRDVECGRYQNG